MTRDEKEATLALHGWHPDTTEFGNAAWVKDGKESVGVDKWGRTFVVSDGHPMRGHPCSVVDVHFDHVYNVIIRHHL